MTTDHCRMSMNTCGRPPIETLLPDVLHPVFNRTLTLWERGRIPRPSRTRFRTPKGQEPTKTSTFDDCEVERCAQSGGTLVWLACAALMPTIALAQAVIAGSVKDTSGAVLPVSMWRRPAPS